MAAGKDGRCSRKGGDNAPVGAPLHITDECKRLGVGVCLAKTLKLTSVERGLVVSQKVCRTP